MDRVRITTHLKGLTPEEWTEIRAAARVLLASCPADCTPAGTIILPGRPETLKLEWRGRGFVLEVVQ